MVSLRSVASDWRAITAAGIVVAAAWPCLSATDQGGEYKPPDRAQDAQHAQADTQKPPPAIAAPASDPDSVQKSKPADTPAHEKGWWGLSYEGWIAISTVVLTAATILLGAFTFGLMLYTRRAVRDSKEAVKAAIRAANAAEQQAAINERTSEAQLRAYMMVSGAKIQNIEDREKRYIEYGLKNFGQTPATRVSCWCAVVIASHPGKRPLFASISHKYRPQWDIIPPQHVPQLSRGDVIRTTDAEEAGLKSGALAIVAIGECRYNDIFGRRHITQFRFFCSGKNLNDGSMRADTHGNRLRR